MSSAGKKYDLRPQSGGPLTFFRTLCLLAAVAYPAFGYVFLHEFPGVRDPLVVRLALAGLPLAVLVLSYWAASVRRRMLQWMLGLFCVLMAHQLHLVQANSLMPEYAVGYLLAWAAIGASLIRMSHMVAFALVFVPATALVSFRIDEPGFSPVVLVTSLVILSSVLLALLASRAQTYVRLAVANDQLLEEVEDRRFAERELSEQKSFLEDILNNVNAEIVVLDSEFRYRFISPLAVRDEKMRERMLHHDDFYYASRMGRSPDVAEQRRAAMERAVDEGRTITFEETFLDGRGLRKHYLRSCTPIFDGNGKVVRLIGSGVDITERKISERAIQYLAYHDSLTGLPGREKMQEQFRRLAAEHERAALFFIDLDRFKMINDTLGHPAGDQLLATVAGRLVRVVAERGQAYRHGGDQFIVLAAIETRRDAADLARVLLEALREPVDALGHRLFPAGVVGIAQFPEDGEKLADLIRHADLATRRAKTVGQNTFHFVRGPLKAAFDRRTTLLAGLRGAIENRELIVRYQPRILLKTRRIVGAEALVRWQHPELGLLAPDEFIPLMEESGRIHELGEVVLREACSRAARWHEQAGATGFHLSANCSVLELKRPEYPDRLQQILASTGLPPDHLELEITESLLMEGASSVRRILRRVRALGVRFSIDDFGTGFSSLSYLRKLQVDSIKIDKSFVREVVSEPGTRAIVEAIAVLASKLGLALTAEGVEDEEQVAFLERLPCAEAQGYLFGRPVAEAEFDALLTAQKRSND